MCKLIKENYHLLGEYAVYLEYEREIKTSTIGTIFSEISKAVKWHALFHQHRNKKFKVKPEELHGFNEVVKSLRKGFKRNSKLIKALSSLRNITYNMHLPEGSSSVEQLRLLQNGITKNSEWVVAFERDLLSAPMQLEKGSYDNFMRMLFSAMYVFSAQGRVSAIQSLTYAQGSELFEKCMVLSSKFKTKGKFGFQPVVLDGYAITLYNIYWCKLRPLMAMSDDSNQSTAPLWLNYNGTKCNSIGTMVTKYFMQSMEINITTNRIRSLLETTVNSLYR